MFGEGLLELNGVPIIRQANGYLLQKKGLLRGRSLESRNDDTKPSSVAYFIDITI